MEEEKRKLREKISAKFEVTGVEKVYQIPAIGLSHEEILKRMMDMKNREDGAWKSGKVSGIRFIII